MLINPVTIQLRLKAGAWKSRCNELHVCIEIPGEFYANSTKYLQTVNTIIPPVCKIYDGHHICKQMLTHAPSLPIGSFAVLSKEPSGGGAAPVS